jgi:hypothetical protein
MEHAGQFLSGKGDLGKERNKPVPGAYTQRLNSPEKRMKRKKEETCCRQEKCGQSPCPTGQAAAPQAPVSRFIFDAAAMSALTPRW